MRKAKTIALALGLGLGLNGMFAGTAVSAPSEWDCQQLKIKCEAGNAIACNNYMFLCRYYR